MRQCTSQRVPSQEYRQAAVRCLFALHDPTIASELYLELQPCHVSRRRMEVVDRALKTRDPSVTERAEGVLRKMVDAVGHHLEHLRSARTIVRGLA